MRKFPHALLSLSLVSPFALALAQDPAESDAGGEAAWAVHGGITVRSDYVWRGVSQTQGNPALQGEVYFENASGFHAGVWASNVDFTARGDEDDGIDVEVDPYIGWSGELGEGVELDVFVSKAIYPGANAGFDYDYTEVEATLSFAEHYHVGLAYSPDIFNLGGRGIYYNAGFEWPLGESGFALQAQLGHYDLEDAAGDSYNDYLVGIHRTFGPIQAALQYTDTSSYSDALSEALDDAVQADGRIALVLLWAF